MLWAPLELEWREKLNIVCCPLKLKQIQVPPDVATVLVDMLLSSGNPESSSFINKNQSIDVNMSGWQCSDCVIKVSEVLLTLKNNKKWSDKLDRPRKQPTSDENNFDRCLFLLKIMMIMCCTFTEHWHCTEMSCQCVFHDLQAFESVCKQT